MNTGPSFSARTVAFRDFDAAWGAGELAEVAARLPVAEHAFGTGSNEVWLGDETLVPDGDHFVYIDDPGFGGDPLADPGGPPEAEPTIEGSEDPFTGELTSDDPSTDEPALDEISEPGPPDEVFDLEI